VNCRYEHRHKSPSSPPNAITVRVALNHTYYKPQTSSTALAQAVVCTWS